MVFSVSFLDLEHDYRHSCPCLVGLHSSRARRWRHVGQRESLIIQLLCARAVQISIQCLQTFELTVDDLHQSVEEHVAVEVERLVQIIVALQCFQVLNCRLVGLQRGWIGVISLHLHRHCMLIYLIDQGWCRLSCLFCQQLLLHSARCVNSLLLLARGVLLFGHRNVDLVVYMAAGAA